MEDQKYTTAKYIVAIEVAKSPNDVFNHLIHDVPKFWPEELEGETSKLNDEFVFKTGDSHYSKNKVVEFEPNKKVAWLVTESIRKTDNYNWTGTKMIFELTPEGDGTLLQFTYDGVVLKNEYDRLVQICDFVIKENLYNLIDSFTTAIEVAKSSQEVFNSIKEVPKWWSKDFEGSSSKLNDEFIIHHPGRHYSKQKLVEVIPNEKIVWLVTEGTLHWLQTDKHEWTNTKMIFELRTSNGKTILHFTHKGLVPVKECYEMCSKGWSMVINDWLFNYITNGKEIQSA
jgi:hypothetical protein